MDKGSEFENCTCFLVVDGSEEVEDCTHSVFNGTVEGSKLEDCNGCATVGERRVIEDCSGGVTAIERREVEDCSGSLGSDPKESDDCSGSLGSDPKKGDDCSCFLGADPDRKGEECCGFLVAD